jgi:hypothetical protein
VKLMYNLQYVQSSLFVENLTAVGSALQFPLL